MAERLNNELDCQVELIKSSGGRFEIFEGDRCLFSKAKEGRFPDEEEIVALLK